MDAESSQLESVSHEVESSQLLAACSHNSSVVGHLMIGFIMLHLLGNKDLIVIFNQEATKEGFSPIPKSGSCVFLTFKMDCFTSQRCDMFLVNLIPSSINTVLNLDYAIGHIIKYSSFKGMFVKPREL